MRTGPLRPFFCLGDSLRGGALGGGRNPRGAAELDAAGPLEGLFCILKGRSHAWGRGRRAALFIAIRPGPLEALCEGLCLFSQLFFSLPLCRQGPSLFPQMRSRVLCTWAFVIPFSPPVCLSAFDPGGFHGWFALRNALALVNVGQLAMKNAVLWIVGLRFAYEPSGVESLPRVKSAFG